MAAVGQLGVGFVDRAFLAFVEILLVFGQVFVQLVEVDVGNRGLMMPPVVYRCMCVKCASSYHVPRIEKFADEPQEALSLMRLLSIFIITLWSIIIKKRFDVTLNKPFAGGKTVLDLAQCV